MRVGPACDPSITLVEIESSSVRLILDGSVESEAIIQKAFESGRLDEVLGMQVEGVFSLPARPKHGFVGRAPEISQLNEAVSASNTVVLTGMGGMGKTTLATEFARQYFPDATCFINLEHGAFLRSSVETPVAEPRPRPTGVDAQRSGELSAWPWPADRGGRTDAGGT